ncbi:MAG: chorismate synthase, partial [Anaerolineales bacterium]|nr:chorismate synthase [Anaerolineales bacterium]
RIVGGVMDGLTTSEPLAFLIENADHVKWKNKPVASMTAPRPGHADLTGVVKYGYRDLRPSLERASARETAMRVAVGAVCKQLLAQFGIVVGGYVISIGEVAAQIDGSSYRSRFDAAEVNEVRCPDPVAAQKMKSRIAAIIRQKDTLGGVIEIIALNLPVGLGSFAQWDRRLEAKLAQAVMSVQAIKGVEIGAAFANTTRSGTRAHDAITTAGDGNLRRPTNRAGGLEGGVTNGQPLVIRAAMKPIATTLTPQQTLDLASGEPAPTRYERSDFCPVPRAVPILEAMVAFVLAEALLEKLGGDSLAEMRPRFKNLRQARLADLPMDGSSHVWW